jgi:hypothetical protein
MRWLLLPTIGYVDVHYVYRDVLLLAQLAGGAPSQPASGGSSVLTTICVLAGLLATFGLVCWQRARSRRPARA